MIGRRLVLAALTAGRDLARRRIAMLMLIALPFAFYASSASVEGSFVLAIAGLGVAWSLTGAGLFLGLGSRAIAPRLVLAGYRASELLAGQVLVLYLFALPLIALFGAVVVAVEQPAEARAYVAAVALTALISVPLGLLLGSLARSELEGTLSLIGILGVQMSLPATTTGAAVLPLHGPMLLIEQAYGNAVDAGLAVPHALIAAGVLAALATVVWARRARIAPAAPDGYSPAPAVARAQR